MSPLYKLELKRYHTTVSDNGLNTQYLETVDTKAFYSRFMVGDWIENLTEFSEKAILIENLTNSSYIYNILYIYEFIESTSKFKIAAYYTPINFALINGNYAALKGDWKYYNELVS